MDAGPCVDGAQLLLWLCERTTAGKGDHGMLLNVQIIRLHTQNHKLQSGTTLAKRVLILKSDLQQCVDLTSKLDSVILGLSGSDAPNQLSAGC